MPGQSVSAIQFGARNSMSEAAPDFDTPQSGSANNYGNKRFTAWATKRGKTDTPLPGTKSTVGTLMDFSDDD